MDRDRFRGYCGQDTNDSSNENQRVTVSLTGSEDFRKVKSSPSPKNMHSSSATTYLLRRPDVIGRNAVEQDEPLAIHR